MGKNIYTATVSFTWNQGQGVGDSYIDAVVAFLQDNSEPGTIIEREYVENSQELVSLSSDRFLGLGHTVETFAKESAIEYVEGGVHVNYIPRLDAFKYAHGWGFDATGFLLDEVEPALQLM